MQIISANDFKFKKQALTLWVGIANIRLVLTIPLIRMSLVRVQSEEPNFSFETSL